MYKNSIILLSLVLLSCASVPPVTVSPTVEYVEGAVVVGITPDGRCVYKPFLKFKDTEDNPDTGEPQILGVTPGDVVILHDEVVFERVLASEFVELHRGKNVHGRLCVYGGR